MACATRVLIKAGNNLLSRYSHYHGPQVLNGRVRNGNGCGHLGMVTGKTHGVACRLALASCHASAKRKRRYIKKAAEGLRLYALLVILMRAFAPRTFGVPYVRA